MNQFADAKTFQDLLELNKKFLKKEIPATFYNLGEIDDETIPLVPALLKLHDYGVLTIGSQPAVIEENLYVAEVWEENGQKCGDWTIDNQQKSYIDAYVSADILFPLITYLSSLNNVFFVATTKKLKINNFKHPKINLTRSRVKKSNYDYQNINKTINYEDKSKEWENETNLSRDHEFIKWRGDNINNILSDKCEISICYNKYGEGSAINILLAFFNK